MDPNDILEAFRNSAKSGDWNGCRSASRVLGSLMAPQRLIDLACIEVRRGLPTFLRVHPGEEWPELILARIEAGAEPTRGMLPINDYDGPGGNSYYAAVEMLVEAALHSGEPTKLVENAIDAIGSVIMARISANWGSENRERWNRWHKGVTSDPPDESEAVLRTLVDMSNDPETIAIKRQSWLDVADAFERTLRT
jgi:hypothetical protein